jgi:hypothetical protein
LEIRLQSVIAATSSAKSVIPRDAQHRPDKNIALQSNRLRSCGLLFIFFNPGKIFLTTRFLLYPYRKHSAPGMPAYGKPLALARTLEEVSLEKAGTTFFVTFRLLAILLISGFSGWSAETSESALYASTSADNTAQKTRDRGNTNSLP